VTVESDPVPLRPLETSTKGGAGGNIRLGDSRSREGAPGTVRGPSRRRALVRVTKGAELGGPHARSVEETIPFIGTRSDESSVEGFARRVASCQLPVSCNGATGCSGGSSGDG
jgi:hypothetical protein